MIIQVFIFKTSPSSPSNDKFFNLESRNITVNQQWLLMIITILSLVNAAIIITDFKIDVSELWKSLGDFCIQRMSK